MTKFEQFLKINTPAGIEFTEKEFKDACGILGLKIESHPHHGGIRVTHPDGPYISRPRGGGVLRYEPAVKDDVVVYTARLIGTTAYGGRIAVANVSELLGKELGDRCAPPVTVPLPERVVTLPVPAWVEVGSEDAYASAYAPRMFESEARSAIDSFNEQLTHLLLR